MADKGVEVSISVNQWPSIENAPSCDQGVDRLPNGYAGSAQGSEVLGGGDSDLKPPDLNEFQVSQKAQRLNAPALMKSRQDLCQDDIAYGHKFCLEQLIKTFDLGVVGAAEEINPDARIDKRHNSRRIASRSPVQVKRPRKARISC